MVLYYRCCIFNLLILSCILDTKTFKQKSYSNDSRSEFQTFTFFDIVKKTMEKKKWLSLYKFAFATFLVPSGNDHHFQMHRSCLMSIVSLSKSCQNLLFQNKKIAFYVIYSFLKGQFPSDSETQYTNYKVCCEKNCCCVVFDLDPTFSSNLNSPNPCNNLELWTRFDPTLNQQLFETI